MVHSPTEQTLFATAPAPMLVVAVDAPRFTITDANHAYLEATSRTREDLVGHGIFEAMPDNPDDAQATGVDNLRASLTRVLRTRRPDRMPLQRYDIRLPVGGFEERWWEPTNAPVLDARGEVTALIHHVTDATWRVRADADLRRLNDTLEMQVAERTLQLQLSRDIIESCVDPICAFDTQYRLIAFNRAHSDEFFRIFGRRVRIGDVFPDLFPPDQAPVMRGFMARALKGEAYTVTEDFGDPALAKPCWEVSYSPLHAADGGILGAFHYARDISARLSAEARLASTQDALRQSQKIEAIGQLTGGVAHDFNNLLTVIRSATDLLKRLGGDEARRERYVSAISEAVDRAVKLTSQLLSFARRQALQPEVFDVAERVRTIGGMIDTLIGARIEVTTEFAAQDCFVDTDPNQFETALVNMAVNARDAMEGEGRLVIRVDAVDGMPATRSHAVLQSPFVTISLTDTGCGIPQERIERIFEPFFTTKAVGQGTGLGLSQVFGFARQSGGDVTVGSGIGTGTTFVLYLPRVRAVAPAPTHDEPEPLMDGSGACVLVVEDNMDIGTFAVQMLDDLGYRTVWAANAQEALILLAQDTTRFDVVFSDVVMPGMNGIELGQEIRRRHPDLPVVLTSGYSHVLAQSGSHGFDLLHKPYSVDKLSDLLRRMTTRQRRRISEPSGADVG